MADSVDPDETAHYEPSHVDLHCLHASVLVWRVERVIDLYLIFSEKIDLEILFRLSENHG